MAKYQILFTILRFSCTIKITTSALLHSDTEPKGYLRDVLIVNDDRELDASIKKEDAGHPLILTNLINEGKIEEAQKAAEVTSDLFTGVKSYSGYLRVDDAHNTSLFFWFFPSESNYEEDPLLLWLQGGPGVSSMFGLFFENGPFIINKDSSLTFRNTSWSKNNSLLYIDQPAGTGFSITNEGYAKNLTKVGNDMYAALIQFFTLFPNLQKNEFFITGESYAGKFIPSISHKILKRNPEADLKINLKGLAIGNGWSVPEYQLRNAEYFYQLGMIGVADRDRMIDIENQAVALIQQEDYDGAREKMDNDLDILEGVLGVDEHRINIFNSLKVVDLNSRLLFGNFLRRKNVRRALHVSNTSSNHMQMVSTSLRGDLTKSVAPLLIDLLNNYRVLLYSGQLDLKVPYPTTLEYLQHLNFNGAEDYKKSRRMIWTAEDSNYVYGYVKTGGNLTEVLVRNAGHMVPADQPEAALQLMNNFVRNKPLRTT